MRGRRGRRDARLAPVLVLASGQRCGSTLVQRLLTSHPEVLIWGEQGGHLAEVLRLVATLRQWDANVAASGRQAFAAEGHHGWLANLLPGSEAIDAALRAYVEQLFAVPAVERGRPVWGFKEVRLTRDDAEALRAVFPNLRVVHLTRDPRDVLRSLDGWERQGGYWSREFTEIAIRSWTEVNASFVREAAEPWVLSARYEDVLAAPQNFLGRLAAHVGLEESRFDRTVFDRRVRDYRGDSPPARVWEKLPADLRALLDDDELRRIAAAYAYRL